MTAHIVEAWWLKPAHLKNTYKIYLSVRPWSKFLYQQIALDVLFQIRYKGRYLYDVRTEGGERGVTQYVTNTTDRLRECVTKGGGVQNPENFADVI